MNFRLLMDAHGDGAHNMACDEAISLAVGRGEQAATLRFYGWQPACISLGQSQRASTVDLAACVQDGIGLVRRSTGGLAILHTDELTYSICMPKGHPLAEGDVMSSYRRISQAILAALRHLGVREPGAAPVPKERKASGPVCFEAPSDYEVVGQMPDGSLKKLVGSAQQRRLDAVLQHGSLPLQGDIGRICRYLPGAPTTEQVRAHAGTLAEALGCNITWQAAANEWAKAFASVLGLTLMPGEMSSAELAAAARLRAEKYAHDSWTLRR